MKTRGDSPPPESCEPDNASAALFNGLFENTANAVALHEIILNQQGTPVDYIFLNANPAFEKHTGLRVSEVIGKKATAIFPQIKATNLIETCGKVVLSGQSASFEFASHGQHFHIHAYHSGPGRFAMIFENITERVKTAETLALERNQLLSIFDSFDEIIYVTDTDTYEILFVNNALKKKFGSDPTGGICYREFQGFSEPCPFCTNKIILAQNPKPYKWEYYNPSLKKTFALHDRIIKWPDGRNVRLELATDITERKLAEQALFESREHLAATLRSIGDGVISTDARGNVTSLNKTAERLTGWPSYEAAGRPVSEVFKIVNAITRQPAENPVAKALCNGAIIGLANHTLLISRDGSEYQLADSCAPILDTSGKVIGAVLAFRDITEEYRQRENIRKNEEKFRMIAETTAEQIWQLDAEGKMIYASPGEKTFGYTPEEVMGVHFFELISESDRERAAGVFKNALAGTRNQLFELTGKRKDGTYLPLEVSVTPILKDGETIGVQGIARDITERKRNEIALRKALQEKETLLRELYHRTKNNMQVIQSMLSMQAAYAGDETITKVFRETSSRINAMAMIHQKLYQAQDLSKINMADYICDLADLLIKSYNLAGVKISSEINVEPIMALIDVAMPCGLILNELISNMFKYAFKNRRSGKIAIKISKSEQGTTTMLVSDDGAGLPDEFDCRRQKTMGMQIIFALAEQQLQGEVNFKTDNGLACIIKFADNSYTQRI